MKKSFAPQKIWLPILLLGLAFALRIYRIDAQDIWGDEAMSIAITALPITQTLVMEANPPVYFWLLRPLRMLWGSSPFALRYLSAIGGILAVALIGQIGQAVGGKQLQKWALLVAAFSPFLIYYGQEARMYATVIPAAAGSFLLFIQIIKRQKAQRYIPISLWIGYGVFSLLAVFSHYYAFAVLLVQGITVLLLAGFGRTFPKKWLIIWTSMAALFLPFFILHQREWGGQTALRSEEWTLGAFLTIAKRTLSAFSLGTTISAEQALYPLAIILIALLGVAWLLRQQKFHALFLFGSLLGGLSFAWAITPVLPFFWERYLLPSLPPFIVLIAAGLDAASRWRKLAALPLAAIVITLSLVSIRQYHFDTRYLRGGYGQAMQLINSNRQPNDLILLNGPLQAFLFDYYQPAGMANAMIPRDKLLDQSESNRWFTDTANDSFTRVWLVESGNPVEYDPDSVARTWLAEHGRFALHRDFTGMGIDMFVLGVPEQADVQTQIDFAGEVELLGYALDSAEINPPDPVLLTLFWQAPHALNNAYTVFTHIVDSNGQVVAQTDRQPSGGSRPTNSWQPNETITDSYAILLPADLPPATYQIRIGLYLWPDLTPISDPIILTTITTH